MFGGALGDVPAGASTWAGDRTVGFRGTAVQISSLADPSLPLVRAILWELAELSFRSDLLAVDKAIILQLWDENSAEREATYNAIFPSEVVGGTWDAPLPTSHVGLFIGRFSDPAVIGYANAFQRLMSVWPDAPVWFSEPLVVSMPERDINRKAFGMMLFYVETFFFSTGRPPVVPRQYPGSWGA
ncbi:hypothetical protein HYDPIDRAFT_33102 [Hydnomerulius pinastri MD-312]|uniref:Unplaced genomic scaffold scaffold_51, whole genome shotgun sequence n=1 Tax=Hydnomerulius pinastri MD-312 TaxID=994086 RepID=A0A0C9V2T8_9AGAM|nr:hypothetical protein HYDPIDRAFT_33102 [Hydnomerulius pinastri MD-312]